MRQKSLQPSVSPTPVQNNTLFLRQAGAMPGGMFSDQPLEQLDNFVSFVSLHDLGNVCMLETMTQKGL